MLQLDAASVRLQGGIIIAGNLERAVKLSLVTFTFMFTTIAPPRTGLQNTQYYES